jgi:hypothetical protein
VAAVVAFAAGFGVERAATGDDPAPRAAPAGVVAGPPVTINNLERAGTMKPLRAVAGTPPVPTTTTVSP